MRPTTMTYFESLMTISYKDFFRFLCDVACEEKDFFLFSFLTVRQPTLSTSRHISYWNESVFKQKRERKRGAFFSFCQLTKNCVWCRQHTHRMYVRKKRTTEREKKHAILLKETFMKRHICVFTIDCYYKWGCIYIYR